jgi:hypothetical protein
MAESWLVFAVDRLFKPQSFYKYHHLTLEGFEVIATKEDQTNAGLSVKSSRPAEKKRQFGANPFQPYRDYYGHFILEVKSIPEELDVKFAIGYTLNSKVTTIDDYSNFGWLRLATAMPQIIYPNLGEQKQLLDYLCTNIKWPPFLTTRIYHFLQNDIRCELMNIITSRFRPGIQ